MPLQQLISHFGECRRRLADLRGRPDYAALTSAILRLEGAGGTTIYNQPFSRIIHDRPFQDNMAVGHGETFVVAFYPVGDGIPANRIAAALAPVEAITRKTHPLLTQLPSPVCERLQLPDSDNWWRIVFHLGWHFPRPFLSPVRCRLLTREGTPSGTSDETFVQLHGTGGRSDLLPGLIYSALQDNDDLCTCSETAVGIIIEVLESYVRLAQATGPGAPTLSNEQRRAFDKLQVDFHDGMQIPQPMGTLECKLLKLADSFNTPPASGWASLEMGGCNERMVRLSRLNAMQEIVQIRGPSTNWFCEVAERAGNALPPWVPDQPILFDDPQRGFGGPRPVINRNPLERWIGFVFASIKQYQPEAMSVRWETNKRPLSHGLATLDRDLFGASALAIDLAGLTTAAEIASKRQRATCCPFSVPSMEEQGFQWAEKGPPPTPPPANYTLGQLVEDLRRFGESYCQAADQIREQNPIIQKSSRIELGAFVSNTRDSVQRIPGFAELREHARSVWDEEISFAVAQRIVDMLVERSNGRLAVGDAEGLTLAETTGLMTVPPESFEKMIPERVKREHAKVNTGLGAGSVQESAVLDVQQDRLHVEDIDNFARVRIVQPTAVSHLLKGGRIEISEDSVKLAIEEILHVPFHRQDRPDELDDIYTANVFVNGMRRPTAFMLKGPGIRKKEMTIADCGKNGDQLVRLFDAPADLFVVQFVGRINEMVIKDVEGKIAALHKRGKKAQFLIIDGQDTARLLFAYDKLEK